MKWSDCEEVYKLAFFTEHDPDALRIIAAAITSVRLDSVPAWLLVAAVPGAGKTALTLPFMKCNDIYHVTSFTPASMASATTKSSPLLDIANFKTLLVTDFSPMMSGSADSKSEALSLLREAFDGRITRFTGLSEEAVLWEGKFGFVGCTTTAAVERQSSMQGQLGERFLTMRITPDRATRLKMAESAARRAFTKKKVETTLQDTFKLWMDEYMMRLATRTINPVTPSDHVFSTLMRVADLLSRTRSPIVKDAKGMTLIPANESEESLTRCYLQLMSLSCSLLTMGFDEADTIRMVSRVGMDSMPILRKLALDAMADGCESDRDIRRHMEMPINEARKTLDELTQLNVATNASGGSFYVAENWMVDTIISGRKKG